MGQQQGRCLRSGHGQRNSLTAGSYILAEGSLNKGSRNGSSSHLQGEDPHGAGAYPLSGIDEAPPSIGDSSTRERLWRLFTFQMGNSKADAYGAATANGTASQQAPISLRRVASTKGAGTEAASHLQGKDPKGAEAYPLPGIDEIKNKIILK